MLILFLLKTSIILLSIKRKHCIKGACRHFVRATTKVFFYLRAIDSNELTEQWFQKLDFFKSCLNVDIHDNNFDMYTFENKIKCLKANLLEYAE
jgi:hypothetical protein